MLKQCYAEWGTCVFQEVGSGKREAPKMNSSAIKFREIYMLDISS
jgi:hypothetical protein